MGYELRLKLIHKRILRELRPMTVEQVFSFLKEKGVVDNEDGLIPIYALDRYFREIYNLGKFIDSADEELFLKDSYPLFGRAETQDNVSEYICKVCGKAGLIEVIKYYQRKVVAYYQNVHREGFLPFVEWYRSGVNEVSQEQREAIHRAMMDVKDDIADWLRADHMLNINSCDISLPTNSWQFKYAVFNLISLLKTIDWDEHELVYMGH